MAKLMHAWVAGSMSTTGEQKAPGMTVPGSSPTRDLLLPHPFVGTNMHLHEHIQGERRRGHHQSIQPSDVTLQQKLFGKDDEMLAISSSSSSSSAAMSSATSSDFPSSLSSKTKSKVVSLINLRNLEDNKKEKVGKQDKVSPPEAKTE